MGTGGSLEMNLAEETGGNTKDSCGEVISPEHVCDVEDLLERSSGESFPKHQNPVLSCLPFTVVSWEGNCVTISLVYFSS